MNLANYRFPEGLRPATLEERNEFYANEFDLSRVGAWFKHYLKKPVFAMIIGRHTRIYPQKYWEDASTTILVSKYEEFCELKKWTLEFLPESVYYDRNSYDSKGKVQGQQLAFDVDPENITCPIHGTLEDKMKRGQGLSFCKTEFERAKAETVRLYGRLMERFSRIKIVYSGRGFHIHVFDKDTFHWSLKERKRLVQELQKESFQIDQWVTEGSVRFIRLPGSLHGMVSRIVTPLDPDELEGFDPVNENKSKPGFLNKNKISFSS